MLVVPEVRFLVVVVRVVVFFVVDLAGVLLLAFVDVDLLTVFAGVLLDVRDVAAVREELFAGTAARLLDGAALGVAIANIRVFGFFGIAARTSRTASVCSSSVIRNSWCPSRLATK